MSVRTGVVYEFGPFRVHPNDRILQRDGQVVSVKAKVFDTLLALIESGGALVSKDDLIRIVWPDSVVEENNLTQNISTLRKVLGEQAGEHRYITTVTGYGYRFVAPVTQRPYDRRDLVVTKHTVTRAVIEDELIIGADEERRVLAPRRRSWLLAVYVVLAVLGAATLFYVLTLRRTQATYPLRLTHHAASDLLPSWSPDGSKIAFVSNRDGKAEIYVRRCAVGRFGLERTKSSKVCPSS